MKSSYIFILVLLLTTTANAQTAFRLCDKEGDCLDISASGELQLGTATVDTGTDGAGAQIRLCDKDGDCLDITSDGELQLQ